MELAIHISLKMENLENESLLQNGQDKKDLPEDLRPPPKYSQYNTVIQRHWLKSQLEQLSNEANQIKVCL